MWCLVRFNQNKIEVLSSHALAFFPSDLYQFLQSFCFKRLRFLPCQNLKKKENKIFKTIALGIMISLFGYTVMASDSIPRTNFGSILKVPLSEVDRVEKGLMGWENWIKAIHPMGEEDMGLDRLTVAKSDSYMGHVFYEVVERYRAFGGSK